MERYNKSNNPDLNKYNTHFNTTSNPNPITKHTLWKYREYGKIQRRMDSYKIIEEN
jgi:hypothetical protein